VHDNGDGAFGPWSPGNQVCSLVNRCLRLPATRISQKTDALALARE
jgi:hypothetical protein